MGLTEEELPPDDDDKQFKLVGTDYESSRQYIACNYYAVEYKDICDNLACNKRLMDRDVWRTPHFAFYHRVKVDPAHLDERLSAYEKWSETKQRKPLYNPYVLLCSCLYYSIPLSLIVRSLDNPRVYCNNQTSEIERGIFVVGDNGRAYIHEAGLLENLDTSSFFGSGIIALLSCYKSKRSLNKSSLILANNIKDIKEWKKYNENFPKIIFDEYEQNY
jgi:hypothetical protein